MKKISPLVLSSLCFAMPYANSTPFEATRTVYQENPHRAYFGPEVFYFDLSTHVECIRVESHNVFGGVGLGYEYLKPNAFYGGAHLLGALSADSFSGHWDGCWIYPSRDNSWFGKGSVRGGYAFGFADGLITPFVGVGGYWFGNCDEFSQSALYVDTGIQSEFGICSFFDLGLNLEVFYSGNQQKKFTYSAIECEESKEMWGGEVGIPLTWHVDPTRKWDIRVEPYFLRLDFSELADIYGVHFLFGYRF